MQKKQLWVLYTIKQQINITLPSPIDSQMCTGHKDLIKKSPENNCKTINKTMEKNHTIAMRQFRNNTEIRVLVQTDQLFRLRREYQRPLKHKRCQQWHKRVFGGLQPVINAALWRSAPAPWRSSSPCLVWKKSCVECSAALRPPARPAAPAGRSGAEAEPELVSRHQRGSSSGRLRAATVCWTSCLVKAAGLWAEPSVGDNIQVLKGLNQCFGLEPMFWL